jgi:hypothetical protein
MPAGERRRGRHHGQRQSDAATPMNTVFPIGLPGPTAFYVTLYVVTFVLHAAFMNYVLAGSLYVAWTGLMPGDAELPRGRQPLAAALRDWLPFALSATITAGVAPLLFVQIVYQQHFYTANLLLSWRWMVLIPALIAAFYLLYLSKSKAISGWSAVRRNAVGVGSAACFVFAAFCWTANHLLSSDPNSWADVYLSESIAHLMPDLVPRLLTTICGSFAAMCAMAGWQLWWMQTEENRDVLRIELRRLTLMTTGGLALAGISAAVYLTRLPNETIVALTGPFALPYVVLVFVGAVGQTAGWLLQLRLKEFCRGRLTVVSASCVLMLVGMGGIREAIRLTAIDVKSLDLRHAAAFEVGGFGVFIGVAVVCIGLMAYCIRLVRTSS